MTVSTAHTGHSGRLTCSGSVRETLLVMHVMAHGHILVFFTVLQTKINKKDRSTRVLSLSSCTLLMLSNLSHRISPEPFVCMLQTQTVQNITKINHQC